MGKEKKQTWGKYFIVLLVAIIGLLLISFAVVNKPFKNNIQNYASSNSEKINSKDIEKRFLKSRFDDIPAKINCTISLTVPGDPTIPKIYIGGYNLIGDSSLIYSDDNGKTWAKDEYFNTPGSEVNKLLISISYQDDNESPLPEDRQINLFAIGTKLRTLDEEEANVGQIESTIFLKDTGRDNNLWSDNITFDNITFDSFIVQSVQTIIFAEIPTFSYVYAIVTDKSSIDPVLKFRMFLISATETINVTDNFTSLFADANASTSYFLYQNPFTYNCYIIENSTLNKVSTTSIWMSVDPTFSNIHKISLGQNYYNFKTMAVCGFNNSTSDILYLGGEQNDNFSFKVCQTTEISKQKKQVSVEQFAENKDDAYINSIFVINNDKDYGNNQLGSVIVGGKNLNTAHFSVLYTYFSASSNIEYKNDIKSTSMLIVNSIILHKEDENNKDITVNYVYYSGEEFQYFKTKSFMNTNNTQEISANSTALIFGQDAFLCLKFTNKMVEQNNNLIVLSGVSFLFGNNFIGLPIIAPKHATIIVKNHNNQKIATVVSIISVIAVSILLFYLLYIGINSLLIGRKKRENRKFQKRLNSKGRINISAKKSSILKAKKKIYKKKYK